MSNRMSLLTFAAALAAAGCSQDDPTSPSVPSAADEMPVERASADNRMAADPAAVVATVKLANGGEVTFLDLGDGRIALGERAPAAAGLLAVAMVERQQATPLEVYLALRPEGGEVPDRLVRDHERVAMARAGSPAPRLLAAPSAAANSLDDPGRDDYTCESTGAQWVADWKAAFVGVTKYREAAYAHNFTQAYFFYPGAPVFYGTNTNSITYLGVCNGDHEDQLMFQVHRWVSGQWKSILSVGVGGGQKYTFYSGVPARYRGKTYGWGGETIEHYGFGAAWTLSPGRLTS